MASWFLEGFHEVIEWSAIVIETFAVAIIVFGVIMAVIKSGTVRYVLRLRRSDNYDVYKQELGKPLLLGLSMLVAADVVKTIGMEFTVNNLLFLGLLVVIRTFFSWTMVVELEGRWPWQGNNSRNTGNQFPQ